MDVTISEVGPRDGLQSIKRTLPTEAKHRWHFTASNQPPSESTG